MYLSVTFGKNTRFDHWLIRVSRALVRYLLLGGGSSQAAPKLKQKILGLSLQKQIEPTNETDNVEYSDYHSVWSRNKQQAKQA